MARDAEVKMVRGNHSMQAAEFVREWQTGCDVKRAKVGSELARRGPAMAMTFLTLMMESGLDFPYTNEFDELLGWISIAQRNQR